MKRQIYRQEALERMGSPEQLDQLMTLTSPRAWVALGGFGLLLLMLVIWAVFGRITTTVEGDGVLVRLGGIRTITAPSDAAVANVFVQTGETVQPGGVLMQLLPGGTEAPRQAVSIESPIAGRVLNVGVFVGDIVKPQDILLTIESTEYPLEAVLYVPASDGYTVQTGKVVRIVPATSQKTNVRYLRGRVASAGKYPATFNELMMNLQNTEWANRLLAMGPALEVVVEPVDDAWPADLYSGVPCHGWITTNEQAPIEFVLPMPGSSSATGD